MMDLKVTDFCVQASILDVLYWDALELQFRALRVFSVFLSGNYGYLL